MTKKKDTMYSPMWNEAGLNLPRDRATLNAWSRAFFALDPDVSRIISNHATLITKYFQLENGDDPNSNLFIKDMLDRLSILSVVEQIITEFFILGESFVYAELGTDSWNKLLIQNPDYIIVKRNINDASGEIYLRPDENLRRLVFDGAQKSQDQVKSLRPAIIENVKNGENILLDPFYVSHFVRRISPYEMRGTSILTPILATLQKIERTAEDTQKIKQVLMDFNVETKTDSIVLDVIYQRYLQMFLMLESWLNKKIINPIGKIKSFKSVPQVNFNKKKLYKDLENHACLLP